MANRAAASYRKTSDCRAFRRRLRAGRAFNVDLTPIVRICVINWYLAMDRTVRADGRSTGGYGGRHQPISTLGGPDPSRPKPSSGPSLFDASCSSISFHSAFDACRRPTILSLPVALLLWICAYIHSRATATCPAPAPAVRRQDVVAVTVVKILYQFSEDCCVGQPRWLPGRHKGLFTASFLLGGLSVCVCYRHRLSSVMSSVCNRSRPWTITMPICLYSK